MLMNFNAEVSESARKASDKLGLGERTDIENN